MSRSPPSSSGYLYAARLAIAELLEECGESAEAERLRATAHELQVLVEDRFWLDEHGFYAMALDGRKQPVTSISSNPGQLLWTGLPTPRASRSGGPPVPRARPVHRLGAANAVVEHRRYNPLSIGGSVWPATALAAAGLWRYGKREKGRRFSGQSSRPPARSRTIGYQNSIAASTAQSGADPYREANVPQAWSIATPVLAAQLFLGLVPDAPSNRCFLDPWVPDWLLA